MCGGEVEPDFGRLTSLSPSPRPKRRVTASWGPDAARCSRRVASPAQAEFASPAGSIAAMLLFLAHIIPLIVYAAAVVGYELQAGGGCPVTATRCRTETAVHRRRSVPSALTHSEEYRQAVEFGEDGFGGFCPEERASSTFEVELAGFLGRLWRIPRVVDLSRQQQPSLCSTGVAIPSLRPTARQAAARSAGQGSPGPPRQRRDAILDRREHGGTLGRKGTPRILSAMRR